MPLTTVWASAAGMSAAWAGTAAASVVAIAAGFGDWRRRRRRDLDRVGVVDWPTVQVVALIAAAICASIALNG